MARRLPAAPWLFVPLLLAVAASWRALSGQLQFDDQLLSEDLGIKDLAGFARAATWLGALAGRRPFADLTFALNYAYGGLEPWNFHVTNLVIHLAAAVLAWSVSRRLLQLAGAARADGVAVAVAGLFALHPLQSEAVSYVFQRSESLAALLYLAALRALLAGDERDRAPAARLGCWLGAGLLFALGLATKPTLVTLPAAWLLVVALVPSPAARAGLIPWRARLAPALALVAVDAAFSARLVGGLTGPDVGAGVGISPATYLATQLRVLPTYLRLLAWPAGQSVDWHLTPEALLDGPLVLLSGALVLACAAGALLLALRARGRDDAGGAAARVAGAGLLWFFLVLAPTSSVIPIVDLLVEHRVYLPALGVFLAAAVAAERLLAARPTRGLAPGLVAATWLLLAGLLHARNAVWETRRALWTDAAAQRPENARAWTNLALAASQEGRSDEAVADWRRGLSLSAGEPAIRCRILANLGVELAKQGRYQEAEEALREGVALQRWPSVENALASVLLSRGKVAEAEALLGEVLAREPAHGESLATLGKLHLMRGDAAGALPYLDRAVAADPDQPQRRYLRARALAGLGRREEACAALSELPGALDRALSVGVTGLWRSLGCGGG